MPTITQEGHLSAPANGLFDDLTVFVSVLVPMRESYKNKLTANGGKITPTEQTADVCILDKLRPPNHLPANKYHVSYEWIDECVLQGKLLPYTDFAIEPKSKGKGGKEVGRPAGRGSVGVKGGTRQPYTDQEDLILVERISKPGVSLNGNKVYQELAADYPQRTWHGWRARWVDKLSKINDDPHYWVETKRNIVYGEGAEEYVKPEEPEQRRAPPPRAAGPRPSKEPARRPEPSKRPEPSRRPPAATQAAIFTAEDQVLLHKFHEKLKKASKKYDAWLEFCEAHTQHSLLEWRSYYSNTLLPVLLELEEEDEAAQRTRPQSRQEVGTHFETAHSHHSDPPPYATQASPRNQVSPTTIRHHSTAARPEPSPSRPAATARSKLSSTPSHATLPTETPSSASKVNEWRSGLPPVLPQPISVSPSNKANKKRKRGSPHQTRYDPNIEIPSTPGASPEPVPRQSSPSFEPESPSQPQLPPMQPREVSPELGTSPPRKRIRRESVQKEPAAVAPIVSEETNITYPTLPPMSPEKELKPVKPKRKEPKHITSIAELMQPPTSTSPPSSDAGEDLMNPPAIPPSSEAGEEDLLNPPMPPSSSAQEDEDLPNPPLPPTSSAGGNEDEDLFNPPLPPTSSAGDEDGLINPPLPPSSSPAPEDTNAAGPSTPLRYSPSPDTDDNDLTNPPLPPSSPFPSPAPRESEVNDLLQFNEQMMRKYHVDGLRVEWALVRAGANTALTDLVLDYFVKGKMLPSHIDGVWSEEQDRIVKGSDARAIERLDRKKGGVKERLEFLTMWEDAGKDDDDEEEE